MDVREQRGRLLAQDKRIKHVEGVMWFVPSQTQSGSGYLVNTLALTCTCDDYNLRHGSGGTFKCKHMWAVEFKQAADKDPGAAYVRTEPSKIPRKTYPQNWPVYNRVQSDEKILVQHLLRGLCDGIRSPPHPGRGPKPVPLCDAVYGIVMKVYTTVSGRRANPDIRACADAGHIKHAPRYNTLFEYMEKPALTPLLKVLIEESAAPLAAVETTFAGDSTGFGTSVYRRWFDHKYGREMKEHGWIKAHAMVGTLTNVVTAVNITDGDANDSPEMPSLVNTTRQHFTMKDVSGDKAYLSHANLAAIEAAGAVPYIPFKSNSQSEGSAAWRRLWGLFMYQHDEFLKHYHQRSNVESTFSAIKRKFGGSVRSKLYEAQVNEVLCKILCHNLSALALAMYELNITATFYAPRGTEAAA